MGAGQQLNVLYTIAVALHYTIPSTAIPSYPAIAVFECIFLPLFHATIFISQRSA